MSAENSTACSTRREFLNTVAWSTAALAWSWNSHADTPIAVKIAKVESFPISYPMVGRFKFFEGPGGRPTGRQAVVVKITADNGMVGWGQSVPIPKWSYETLETVHSTLTHHLAPELMGRNPLDIDGIHAAMNRAIAPSFSTGQPICKAGVDLALFDLTGKLRRQSAAQLWGRKSNERLTLSWTLNPRTLDEIEPLITQGRARGYRHFNVKVAPDPKFDLELCRIVKRLVPDGFLWADANGGYDEETALAVAPELADIGVSVLEQPLPANRLTGYRRLKRQGALPIIMDEGIVSSVELEEFIKLELLDGVAMKPARCGGITEARRQIEIVQRAGQRPDRPRPFAGRVVDSLWSLRFEVSRGIERATVSQRQHSQASL
jgi:L-alanine-DL-glutamate epimerase-like enolase superfamily enzyme